MTANYVLLEKITVGAAGASSVTFSNIPQTGYTDLVVAYSMRNNRSTVNAYPAVQFNGSASSLSQREVFGNGSGAFSASGSIIQPYAAGNGATSNTFGSGSIYIPNYTSSNFKSVSVDAVGENNGTEAHSQLLAGLWSNTAAITSITILAGDSSTAILQYSTFYLYGVAKLGTTPAIVPYATGGDTIETDGTYWYHAFLSSGTFTPQKGISCDVLVVAGGGGGAGAGGGGGGGAGGLLAFTSQSIGSAQTVTVGAGGSGTNDGSTNGGSGSNSVFGSLTAAVGGGGGGFISGNGANGGSGGGVGRDSTSARTGGTATSGQGFRGGNGISASAAYAAAGGGGGAGAVGGNGSVEGGAGAGFGDGGNGGNGGAGVNTYSSWLSVTGLGVSGFIAGGGGGAVYTNGNGRVAGTGGSGGGANGGTDAAGSSATANTGSGGGGGRGGSGGSGGSGLVIVRYPV
jgi:hypothetical protein